MDKDKLNPQKPGITQPRDPKDQPHPRQPQRGGGASGEPQSQRPAEDDDKRRQVPIEGE